MPAIKYRVTLTDAEVELTGHSRFSTGGVSVQKRLANITPEIEKCPVIAGSARPGECCAPLRWRQSTVFASPAIDPALPDQIFDQLVDHFAGAIFHIRHML